MNPKSTINPLFNPLFGINTLLGMTLCLTLLGCSSPEPEKKSLDKSKAVQPQTPSDKAADAPKETQKNTKPIKMTFEGPGEKLPKKVDDWQISSAPRYFGPENLYDLINGGAEIYVQFGLTKMVTADYKSDKAADQTLTAEIYDMGSSLGAFGRTARFLENLQDPSAAGNGLPKELTETGIFGDGDLVIYKDKYLIHLTLMDESAEATVESIKKAGEAILPKFAAQTLAGITTTEKLPEAIGKFPTENLINRTQGYHPKNLLGIPGLLGGFFARYQKDKTEWTAFVSVEFEDAAKAQAAIDAGKGEKGNRVLKVVGKRVIGISEDSEKLLQQPQMDKLLEALQAQYK